MFQKGGCGSMAQQTCALSVSRICMFNLNLLAFIVTKIETFVLTDGYDQKERKERLLILIKNINI